MIVAGHADGYHNMAFRTFAALRAPKALLFGPWSHMSPSSSMPGPRIDIVRELIRWFDRFLRGLDDGADPPIRIFVRRPTPPAPDLESFRGAWRVPDGRILAAAAPSRELALLAAAGGSEIRLETRSLRDGALLGVEALPGARAPVLLGAGGWKLFWDGEGLLAVPPGAAPERVALPCRPEPLEQAGDGLAAAYCGGRRFGVTLAPAGVRAFELPAAREEGSR